MAHRLIIILGILLTLLIEAPLLAFPFVSKNYQGINIPHFSTDSHFYLSRAKEALEGHKLGSVFLREGKNEQDMFFMYNERVLTAPLRLLGLADKINIVTVYNFYNFIGVFILVVLVYFFVLQISGDKLFAVTAAIFAIGGYHIVYRQFLYNDFNMYGRPMYPYISSLAFFTYLNSLALWLKTQRLAHQVLSAILLGLLFYVYVFAWTFALALNGALFLIYFWKRDWTLVKSLIFISAIGALIGFYNLFQMWTLFHSGIGAQIAYFHWSSRTHLPIFSKIGAVTLFVWVVFAYKNRKKQDPNNIFIFAIILAGWVSLNQQIITGKAVQIGHYYWYFIVPLSIIIFLYMLRSFIKEEFWRNAIWIFILTAVFFHAAVGQYRSFFISFPGKEYEQLYRPIIAELQKDPNPGVVLADNDYLAYLVTIYTNHDLFLHPTAVLTATPFGRFSDALYAYMYINKDARGDFSGYLHREMEDTNRDSLYEGFYRYIEGFNSGLDYYDYTGKAINNKTVIGPLRDKLIAELSANYSKLANDNAMNGFLKKYGVNYIVWDKNKYPEWDLNFIKGLQEAASSSNIYLYRII